MIIRSEGLEKYNRNKLEKKRRARDKYLNSKRKGNADKKG